MSAVLAAVAALALVAAARELWAIHGEAMLASSRRVWTRRLGPSGSHGGGYRRGRAAMLRRIEAAGLGGRVDPLLIVGARLIVGLVTVPIALGVAPVLPARLGAVVVLAAPLALSAAPDIYLERRSRRRRRAVAAALPDALELMAVGAASGRGPVALLGEAAGLARGPLRDELARAVAELESGRSVEATLGRMARESVELAAVAVLIERSRRLGSPLAEGLRDRSAALRGELGRLTREQAARAAPKIQLTVALLLVPSVLLILAAAILANSEALLSGL